MADNTNGATGAGGADGTNSANDANGTNGANGTTTNSNIRTTTTDRQSTKMAISDSALYTSLKSTGYQEETSRGGLGGAIADAFTDLGDMFWNDRREPVPTYNFFVRGEMGLLDAPCKSVRAFTREFDYEEIQEGGRNDYVILKRKPITHRYTLQLERYVGMDVVDPFALGTEFMAPLLIGVKRVLPRTSGFADTMTDTELIRLYTFTGCIVTGKEYGGLDAEKSGLLTETVTIAYREMICLTTPNADNVVEHWKITDNDDTKKKLKRSSNLLDTWEDTPAKVYSWNVGGTDKEGKNLNDDTRRSAVRPSNDGDAAPSKKWNIGKDTDGKKNLNVDENRSAKIPANDSTASPISKWNIGTDVDKVTNLNIPGNRSSKRYDDLDAAKAPIRAWGISNELRDDKNKSAKIPTSDENKPKAKEWKIRDGKGGDANKSAVAPPSDSRKAKKKSWQVTKKDKNKSAIAPTNDTDSRDIKGWDINDRDKNKSAQAPSGDDKEAKAKSWDINDRVNTRKAVAPDNDSDKAESSAWNIKEPDKNRHAVIMKNAADVASFLSR